MYISESLLIMLDIVNKLIKRDALVNTSLKHPGMMSDQIIDCMN